VDWAYKPKKESKNKVVEEEEEEEEEQDGPPKPMEEEEDETRNLVRHPAIRSSHSHKGALVAFLSTMGKTTPTIPTILTKAPATPPRRRTDRVVDEEESITNESIDEPDEDEEGDSEVEGGPRGTMLSFPSLLAQSRRLSRSYGRGGGR